MGRHGSTPYPKELRDQAVRLVREWRKAHDRRDGGIREVAMTRRFVLALVVLAAVLISACGSSSKSSNGASTTTAGSPTTATIRWSLRNRCCRS